MSSIHLQGMTPCCFCQPFWQMNSTDSQWPGHWKSWKYLWKSIGFLWIFASHAEGKLFWTDQPIATELWEIHGDTRRYDATMSVAKKAQHLTDRASPIGCSSRNRPQKALCWVPHQILPAKSDRFCHIEILKHREELGIIVAVIVEVMS